MCSQQNSKFSRLFYESLTGLPNEYTSVWLQSSIGSIQSKPFSMGHTSIQMCWWVNPRSWIVPNRPRSKVMSPQRSTFESRGWYVGLSWELSLILTLLEADLLTEVWRPLKIVSTEWASYMHCQRIDVASHQWIIYSGYLPNRLNARETELIDFGTKN